VLTIVLIVILFLPSSFAQTDCAVELASIRGKYEGDCKKGLANGKGKPIGTDTDEGEFKKDFLMVMEYTHEVMVMYILAILRKDVKRVRVRFPWAYLMIKTAC